MQVMRTAIAQGVVQASRLQPAGVLARRGFPGFNRGIGFDPGHPRPRRSAGVSPATGGRPRPAVVSQDSIGGSEFDRRHPRRARRPPDAGEDARTTLRRKSSIRSFTAVLLFAAASAFAHPSVSVVIDSKGNVYYSDLTQILRIAPDGTRTVAVPHVHSHELYLDASDTLYGENLWYNGETLKTWGNAVWKRTPDGRILFVHPCGRDSTTDFSSCAMWPAISTSPSHDQNEIRRKSPDCACQRRDAAGQPAGVPSADRSGRL